MVGKQRKLYWCGWNVPRTVPNEHILEAWPEGMQGWITAETLEDETVNNGFIIWTGGVIATSPLEAWRIVLSCFGPSSPRIVKRWEPEERPEGWEPGNRFPGFSLKVG